MMKILDYVCLKLTILLCIQSLVTAACNNLQEDCAKAPSSKAKAVTTFTPPVNHRLLCTKKEKQKMACLNGGKCQAAVIDSRLISCGCTTRYIGKRCEMIDPTYILRDPQETVTPAVLAVGIIFPVLFILLLVVIIVWWRTTRCKKGKGAIEKQQTKYRGVPKADENVEAGIENMKPSMGTANGKH